MNKEQLLPILNRLLNVTTQVKFYLKNGIIYCNDEAIEEDSSEYSAEEFQERVNIFASILNIPDVIAEYLYIKWKNAFEDNIELTKKELLELAKKSTLRKDKSSIIEDWADAFKMKFLFNPGFELQTVEEFSKFPTKEEKSKYLELAPITKNLPQKLLYDKKWSLIETAFENIKPFKLDDVWIDLEFIEPWIDDMELSSRETYYKAKFHRKNYSSKEPIDLILEIFSGFMIIVGAPGSGKTTLLKWIARSLIKNPNGRFILPLFVPLREYVIEHQRRDITILDFAFEYVGIKDKEQIDLWINTISYITQMQKETVLLLLDGWDEVPISEREWLKREIEELSYAFSIILTSRHSGYPKTFSADKLYEIGELSDTQVEQLILKYYQDDVGEAEKLLLHLKEYQDLYEMGRNPFLLTLLCGISFHRSEFEIANLPKTRTEIYNKTINYIYKQHNYKYPSNQFNEDIKNSIKKLAYHIFNNEIPRYFFDDSDINHVFKSENDFESVVKLSRLLSQITVDKSLHQFLHTTFQEYFIALNLSENRDELVEFLNKYLYSDSAIEIIGFISGISNEEIFWEKIKELIGNPDIFGLIYLKVAKLLLETKNRDIDIRGKLWESIVKSSLPMPKFFMEALSKLDMNYLKEQVEKVLSDNKTSVELETKIKRAMSNIRDENSSLILVNEIINKNEEGAGSASYALENIMGFKAKNKLYEVLSGDYDFKTKKYSILALGYAKDELSIDIILKLLNDKKLQPIIIEALGYIGSNLAVKKLMEIYKHASYGDLKSNIIKALGSIKNLLSRDKLLEILIMLPKDSILIKEVLWSFYDLPISKGSSVILGFLRDEFDIDIQKNAMYALKQSTKQGITDKLRDIAKNSTNEELRETALEVLEDRCGRVDIFWLSELVRNEILSVNERFLALENILRVVLKLHHRGVSIDVEDLVIYALKQNSRFILPVTARYLIKNDNVLYKMKEMFESDLTLSENKGMICDYFAKMKIKEVTYMLSKVIQKYPNTGLAISSAQALCEINISEAITISGETMKNVLFRYALENGLLIYGTTIIDSNGKNILEG